MTVVPEQSSCQLWDAVGIWRYMLSMSADQDDAGLQDGSEVQAAADHQAGSPCSCMARIPWWSIMILHPLCQNSSEVQAAADHQAGSPCSCMASIPWWSIMILHPLCLQIVAECSGGFQSRMLCPGLLIGCHNLSISFNMFQYLKCWILLHNVRECQIHVARPVFFSVPNEIDCNTLQCVAIYILPLYFDNTFYFVLTIWMCLPFYSRCPDVSWVHLNHAFSCQFCRVVPCVEDALRLVSFFLMQKCKILLQNFIRNPRSVNILYTSLQRTIELNILKKCLVYV